MRLSRVSLFFSPYLEKGFFPDVWEVFFSMAPIVASFTADVTSGNTPLTVTFSDTSSGGPTSWMWNFGDGNTSPLQNPVHIYTVGGLYTVTLVAYISTGAVQINGSLSPKDRKIGTHDQSYQAAYNNFVADPWAQSGNVGIEYGARHLSPSVGYQVRAGKADWSFNLSGYSPLVYQLIFECAYADVDSFDSFAVTNGIKFPETIFPATLDLIDVTSYGEGVFVANFQDGNGLAQLPQPPLYERTGWSILVAKVMAHSFSSRGSVTNVDFIQVGPVCVPNGWLVLSSSKVPRIPSGFDLVVSTDYPAHLFARYMPEVPTKTTLWKVKYGMPYRCQPVFDMLYSGQVEQSEAGETIEHTFNMSVMPASKTLVIVLHGTQCSLVSASRGPLMLYDNTV